MRGSSKHTKGMKHLIPVWSGTTQIRYNHSHQLFIDYSIKYMYTCHTHISYIYIYAKIFWALILMLVQCQHKHALYFHSRLRVQKSIEMAAVYIHTYKLVCMLPQLYRYLVNIRTYIFDISIANYHISLQPLYKPSIGPKKLILPSACVLISELPCSTWKVSDIKRPSASVLLASCMSDVWTVDVWHRSQGNH